MEKRPYKQSLLVLPVAGDVDTSTDAELIQITGLMPIRKANYKGSKLVVAAAEVVQIVNVGLTTAPTIVAGAKYKLIIGNTRQRSNAETAGYNNPYGYTAPATLTGTAADDRGNAYASLAYKINEDTRNNVTAYAVITVAQTNSVPFAVGEVVTETATGATGINLSGTTGTLTIAVTSGTFLGTTAGTLTGSIAGASTSTTHVVTNGIALRIVDDAGYYNAAGTRFGASSVIAAAGFVQATHIVYTTAAVYSQGQGTRMLQDKPVKEVSSDNLASGSWQYPSNRDPVAGEAYNMFIIKDVVEAPAESNLTNSVKTLNREQIVWADNDAAGYAAFAAAIAALTIT